MAKSASGQIVIDDLTGGRNAYDPAWAIANNQCADAVNVDWFRSRFANKRGGMSTVSLTFSAGGPFTDFMVSLLRFVPGADDTLAELWAIDNDGVWGRMAGAATFSAPTIKDAITVSSYQTAASINGKLAVAYKSAVARMHGWDGSTVRRFGLAASAAPTAANGGGAGAYAAVLRYYRQRSTRQVATVTVGRSEPSASVSFTPGGANLNATVTQATVINEGETHWEVEASLDNVTFYRIATVAIATTTYADSAATTTYNTNPLSAATGIYTLQKPYKFIAADQNRLLGYGSYTAADKQSRIEYSSVIGSLDVGDEERVDTTTNYYIDLDENDSGGAAGIGGPVLGSFFAFKFRQTWRLTPTGQVSQPFRADPISKSVGCVSHRSIQIGEDADGNPCIYWMSHRGPYRWGQNGLEYLGRGVEDLLLGPIARIRTDFGYEDSICHTLFYQDKRQVWFIVNVLQTSTGTLKRYLLQYDIEKNAWSRFLSNTDTAIVQAFCSVMFSNTLGAAMSADLKPYLGGYSTFPTPEIHKADTGADDLGTSFQGYVTTKAYEPGGPGYYGELSDGMLMAAAATGVTIPATVTPDFGAATAKTGTALLTAAGSETRVEKRLEDSTLSGFRFYQYTIGDAAATTAAWTLDRVTIPFTKHEAAS